MTPAEIEAVIAGLSEVCPSCHGAKEIRGRACNVCAGRGDCLTPAGLLLLSFINRYRDRLGM